MTVFALQYCCWEQNPQIEMQGQAVCYLYYIKNCLLFMKTKNVFWFFNKSYLPENMRFCSTDQYQCVCSSVDNALAL